MKKSVKTCGLEDRHIPKLIEQAQKNWERWNDVFEHDGPIDKNPVLADGARFASFCAEYSVHRTIWKGKRDEFRQKLIGSSKFSEAIQDCTGDSLDKLEQDLRPDFGSKRGKNRLTSVLSKVAAFVRPERFVAWDRFAKTGLNSVLGRRPSSPFNTYSEYLAAFDRVWDGQEGKHIKAYVAKGGHAEVEGANRFLRRVLDLYLMKCGGRWRGKRRRK